MCTGEDTSARADVATGGLSALTVDELMEEIARGDHCAFAHLHRRVAPRVVWRIRRALIDPAQSEEVAQEVFLEVWQNAHRFESQKASATTWIFTIAHRRAVDRVRASQSSQLRDRRVGMRDAVPHFDHVAEAGEVALEYRRVRRAMEHLPHPQRQTIDLVYTDGYSQTEAASMLGLPVGTVKTRLRDGLARLRRELSAGSITVASGARVTRA